MSDYYEPTIANQDAQSLENKVVRKALTKLPEPYISGLKLNADIEINNLTLNTIEKPNPFYNTISETLQTDNTRRVNNYNPYGPGVVWVVSDIDGWWNLPESEIPDLPRGWGDGSYDAIGRFSTRNITLVGSFLTQDPEDVPAARSSILGAVNLVKSGGWLIVDENPKKAAYVRLTDSPKIRSVSARGRHDFSIGLVANDPIKYEYVDGSEDGYRVATLTASSGGTATANVVNSGDVAVPIVIELSKGFVVADPDLPATITNTANDQVITIIEGTESDTKLEIDTYNREVLDVEYTLNPGTGLDEVTNVTNARSKVSVLVDWIYLQPGTNTITLANFPSGSTCTIYYRSGWLS